MGEQRDRGPCEHEVYVARQRETRNGVGRGPCQKINFTQEAMQNEKKN